MIDALIATRIVIQFGGQAVGLVALRRRQPDLARPYRVWLYPIPVIVALIGWTFVLVTTDASVLAFGAGALGLGLLAFLVWIKRTPRPIESPPDPQR